MAGTDAERLAVLETENKAMMADIQEIKQAVKRLEALAARGGGAFNAILMIGGLLGWVAGMAAGLYAMLRH